MSYSAPEESYITFFDNKLKTSTGLRVKDFKYFKKITITNASPGYQLELKIHKGSGTDNTSTGDIYMPHYTHSDFADIAFADSYLQDTANEFYYWIENYTSDSYARVWIRLPDNASGTYSFYFFYESNTATDNSDGENTFPDYFYDFKTDKTADWRVFYWDGTGGPAPAYNYALHFTNPLKQGKIQSGRFRYKLNIEDLNISQWTSHLYIGLTAGDGDASSEWGTLNKPNSIFVTDSPNMDGGATTSKPAMTFNVYSGSNHDGTSWHTNSNYTKGNDYIQDILWDVSGTRQFIYNSSYSIIEENRLSYTPSGIKRQFFRYGREGGGCDDTNYTFEEHNNEYLRVKSKGRHQTDCPNIYISELIDWMFVAKFDTSSNRPTYDSFSNEKLIPEITNASGCISTSTTTATVTSKVINGSGNCYIYYGTSDGGFNKSTWDSSKYVGVKYSGNYFETQISGLNSNTTYYYNSYISSNGWGAGEDWAPSSLTFTTEVLPIQITNASGCVASSLSTATLSAKVTLGSGNTWIFYDTQDRGTVKGAWYWSSNCGYHASGDYFTKQVSLSPSINPYYYRAYISSMNGSDEDWADSASEFYVPMPVSIYSPTGCLESGSTYGIVDGRVGYRSGNCWIYYGKTDGGTNKTAWDNNVSIGLKYYHDYFTKKLTGLEYNTKYYFNTYISSNGWGFGEDWGNSDSFHTTEFVCHKNLKLFYNPAKYPNAYLCLWCKRWDVSNYELVIETFMTKSDLKTLRSNITPGAVSEFYKILDRPIYHDTTYTASNTIKLEPNEEISDDRRPVVAFVKDISDDIIEGPSGYLSVKLDCYISGTQSL